MNTRLLLAACLRSFTRYKLRSLFMSVGIVIGVATLVVMRSFGAGAEREMLEKVERMFSASTIIVSNSGSFRKGGGREPGKLDPTDVQAVAEQLEQVTDQDPMFVSTNVEVRYGDGNRTLNVFGHSERAEFVWQRGVIEGEFFSAADVRSAARVALIGTRTAKELFGDADPLGKQIQIGNAPYRVKGVLEPHGVDPHGWDRDDEVQVPITTAMRRLENATTISSAKLVVSRDADLDATVDQVAEILRKRHGLAADRPDDFAMFTPTQVRKMVRQANRVTTVYLPATAAVALLVAAIVIANIMLIGVRERIPEIGLRKAVGATDRQIGAQFLLESVAVTLISGVLGAAVGATVLVVAASHFGPAGRVEPEAVGLGLAAALLVGLLAGVLPARQASRQEPVDALR